MGGFGGLNLNKVDVGQAEVEVNPSRELDLLRVLSVIADETINDVGVSYYGNGGLIESAANKSLHRIKGRMLAMKALIQSVK